MNTRTNYGNTHVFTNRSNDTDIILQAGAGETIAMPNLKITNATIGSLNGNVSMSSLNMTSGTIAAFVADNHTSQSSTISSLVSSNASITNGSITRLNVSIGTIGNLRTTNLTSTNSSIGSLRTTNLTSTSSTISNLNVSSGTISTLRATSATDGSLNITQMNSNSYFTLQQPALYFSSDYGALTVDSTIQRLNRTFWNNYETKGDFYFDADGMFYTTNRPGIYGINAEIVVSGTDVGNLQFGVSYLDTSVGIYTGTDIYQTYEVPLYLNTFLEVDSFIGHFFYVYKNTGSAVMPGNDNRRNRGYVYYLNNV